MARGSRSPTDARLHGGALRARRRVLDQLAGAVRTARVTDLLGQQLGIEAEAATGAGAQELLERPPELSLQRGPKQHERKEGVVGRS